MKTYTAAIIGCGSIGTSKPDRYDRPEGQNILTHAHSIHIHPRTKLIAVVDTDIDKAKQAAAKWNCAALSMVSSIDRPDIAVVAVPTEAHYEILLALLLIKPRLVITEKPFTDNNIHAKNVAEAYEAANIPLIVNYTRRFVPEIQQIRDMIQSQELGAVQGCRAIYTRGLKREASHLIDLCNWFFGGFIDGEILPLHISDYSVNDLTYAVHLEYEHCPHVFFTPADGRQFSIFEVDILFERGRIILYEYGLKCAIFKTMPEPVYGDYEALCYSPEVHTTGLNTALLRLVNNAVRHLDRGEPLLCSGRDALKVHEIIERLI